MSISAERFATGMTFPEYVAQMRENRDRFVQTAEAFDLAPEDQARIGAIEAQLNVLVLTEDWCGDALTYLPVLARVAAGAPRLNVRIFNRDANPDLADQYLNQGRWRSVPVVVFYDAEMRELGRFIERPAIANA